MSQHWAWRLPFLSLLFLHVLVLSTMHGRHLGGAADFLMPCTLALWASVILFVAVPADCTRHLLRMTTSVSLAVAPFAWYGATHFYRCFVAFADCELFMAVILVGPPLVWRLLVPCSRMLADDNHDAATRTRWASIQLCHFLVWMFGTQLFLLFEVWLPDVSVGRLVWERELLGSMSVFAFTALLLAPCVGVAGVFQNSRLSPHVACVVTALIPLLACLEL